MIKVEGSRADNYYIPNTDAVFGVPKYYQVEPSNPYTIKSLEAKKEVNPETHGKHIELSPDITPVVDSDKKQPEVKYDPDAITTNKVEV